MEGEPETIVKTRVFEPTTDVGLYCENRLTVDESNFKEQFGEEIIMQIRHSTLDRFLTDILLVADAISKMADDEDPDVRADFIGKIPGIFIECYEKFCEEIEYHLYDRLIHIILNGLRDIEAQVRKSAFTTLCLMIEKYLIDRERLVKMVCPSIVELSHIVVEDPQLVDYYTIAVGLMTKAAPVIGQELTEEYFLKRYLELCEHEAYIVRRLCATYYPDIWRVMRSDVTEKILLKQFVKLCEDNVWSVRNACSEVISIISLMCSYETRWKILSPIFLNMLRDGSRWVCVSAFKAIGRFISSFAKPLVTGVGYTSQGELQIVNMADEEVFNELCDADIMKNLQFYEKLFEESMTQPSTSTTSTSQHNNSNDVIIENLDKMSLKTVRSEFFTYVSKKTSLLILDRESWCEKISKMTMEEALPPLKYNLITDETPSLNTLKNDISSPANRNSFRISDSITSSSNMIDPNFRSKINLFSDILDDYDLKDDVLTEKTAEMLNLLNDTNNVKIDKSSTAAIDNNHEYREAYEVLEKLRSSQSFERNNFIGHPVTDNFRKHLKKHTPTDLPSIIEQAISNRQKEFEEKNNLPNVTNRKIKNEFKINVDERFKDIPPETPSIEDSPKFMSFDNMSMYNSNFSNISKEEDADENVCDNNSKKAACVQKVLTNLDILSTLADYSIENLSSNNNNSVLISENLDEDDEESKKFNSHQFWYISPPELPLDDIDLIETNLKNIDINKNEPEKLMDESIDQKNISIDSANINNNESDEPQQTPTSAIEIETVRAKLALAILKRDLILGPNKFCQDVLPPELLSKYVTMINCSANDMDYYAAFNFPAVLLTVGRDNWNFLCNLMASLCANRDYKIRQTMAASIFQIALILGRDLTKRDLVPLFVEFFHDLEEVVAVALKNLSSFLKVVDLEYHDEIVSCLENCFESGNSINWRIRAELAKQVLELFTMYENTDKKACLLYLTGLAFRLLMDKVHSVREIAIMAIVVRPKSCNKSEINFIINIMIEEFAHNDHWRRRQSYVILCHKMLLQSTIEPEVFAEGLLNELFVLASDAVPNVRLVVGRCLSTVITSSYFNKPKTDLYLKICEVIRKLQYDSDGDVREMSRNIEIDLEDGFQEPPHIEEKVVGEDFW